MPYFVVYSVMGQRQKEEFPTLEDARADFSEKKRLDDLQVFDDRFVIGIEDGEGRRIDTESVAA